MNCPECKDQLAGFIEGLLDKADADRLESHMANFPTCQAEFGEVQGLCDRLVRDGRPSSLSLETKVMDQIMRRQAQELRRMKMRKRYRFIGASGVAAAACIALFVSIWFAAPNNRVQAAEVLAKGAEAVSDLRTIHMKCRMRTGPGDNFANIAIKQDLVPVELWKEFAEQRRWRIEKPKRVVVMDGESTIMLIGKRRGIKIGPSQGAFDTSWLHHLAAVGKTINNELNSALAKGRDLKLTNEKGADGSRKQIVSVEVKSGLDDSDYLKNKFFMDADTRRVYRFDAETGRLEGIKVYCHTANGDVLIFETTQIDYNQPIARDVFSLKLPKDVIWYEEPKPLVDNEKYERMTPKQAAQAFFEACSKQDWTEARKFWTSSIDDRFKKGLGGLEIVNIGEPFRSKAYPGWFVPYEIKLKGGRVKKWNLALKKNQKAKRFIVDGGL